MNHRPDRPNHAAKRRFVKPNNSSTPASSTTIGKRDQFQLAVCALRIWYGWGLVFGATGGVGCLSSPTTTSLCEEENSGLHVVRVIRLSPKLSNTATSLGETACGVSDTMYVKRSPEVVVK